MIIGVPKEIKIRENRVAVTPGGAAALVNCGHKVLVEKNAGIGSGFSDSEYNAAGAIIADSAEEIFSQSEMIVKVKEPLESEYKLVRSGQILFTYLHFASSLSLTKAMMESGSICIAYETVEKPDKSLPLLIPMSEVAGRMAVQKGANYLEKQAGGRGVLLGGVPGVKPGNVVILGAGIVGTNAAKMAAGLGASVTIMDINPARLRQLADILPSNVTTVYSTESNIKEALKTADLVIGAVLVPGGKAPLLVKRDMLKLMKPGSVVIDVAVDQGGCIETCKPTTHENPTYVVDEIIHYCVANMPGAVPFTSTMALTNVTLPYISQIANKGWLKACKENQELKAGLNIIKGKIVYKELAEAFDLPFTNADSLLS
ncbi:MAG: alanine dehydrogenase [Cytophagaceae bacterium]